MQRLSFVLLRKQFHIKLSFAITINKSQGQAIPNVGIYLPHAFSRDQLYVALSIGVSQASTNILIKEGQLEGKDGNLTKNVIFKEILLTQTQVLFLFHNGIDKFIYLFYYENKLGSTLIDKKKMK